MSLLLAFYLIFAAAVAPLDLIGRAVCLLVGIGVAYASKRLAVSFALWLTALRRGALTTEERQALSAHLDARVQ